MEELVYLGEEGLAELVNKIKEGGRAADVYIIKGSAIYADTDYVTHAQQSDPGYYHDITSVGLWQLRNGVWTNITSFEKGWVYNIQHDFTTDNAFIEGANIKVTEGANIVVAEATGSPATYKWDILGSIGDLSAYQTKNMVEPLAIYSVAAGTAVSYANVASLPATDSYTVPTFKLNDVAILTDAAVSGDLYRITSIVQNTSDPTISNITWAYIGNQKTVESALELLSKIVPTRPISKEEIIEMFNN